MTASADAAGIWTIQTGIFQEDTASLRLHYRPGPAPSATREPRRHRRWRERLLLDAAARQPDSRNRLRGAAYPGEPISVPRLASACVFAR
jgi:hypothetical protein